MLLRTEALTKAFGGLLAVNTVNLELAEGEVTAIIGPNGSGKTTFFNVLSGILPATAGKVFFKGEDVTRLKAHAMTGRGMARTFQNIRLFQSLTAHDNVVVGRYSRTHSGLWDGVFRSARLRHEEQENRAQAEALLHFVRLDAYADTMAKNLPYGAAPRCNSANPRPHRLLTQRYRRAPDVSLWISPGSPGPRQKKTTKVLMCRSTTCASTRTMAAAASLRKSKWTRPCECARNLSASASPPMRRRRDEAGD